MEHLSFIVPSRPVSQQTGRRGRKTLLPAWKAAVEAAARVALPSGFTPFSMPIEVRLTCFLDFDIDVDNVAKPMLDALKGGIVLADDSLVAFLTVRKVNLNHLPNVTDPPPDVAAALASGRPFVHVEVTAIDSPNDVR